MSHQILSILPTELDGPPNKIAACAEQMLWQYEADAGLAHEGQRDRLTSAVWPGRSGELPPRATYAMVIRPDGTRAATEYLASLLEQYAKHPAAVVER